jgi:proline dehydrogenase
VARNVVGRFVAGKTLAEALPPLAALQRAGLHTTIDVLGESVTDLNGASRALHEYEALLEALTRRQLDLNISVKLTQLGLDLDRRACQRNFLALARAAGEVGAFVRIDMEDSRHVDSTLELARATRAQYPHIGVVIQAYLRRSSDDLEALLRERIAVRLCKGAYDEPRSVAFDSKAEVDRQYQRLTERLMADGEYPAIATHDQRLIEWTRAHASRIGRAPESFEFQMLYGIRRDLQSELVRAGYRVRVYVPYGINWYAYFMRRLAERPANLAFLVGNVWRDRGA